MDKMNLAYCNECEDLVEFTEQEEIVEEYYRGIRENRAKEDTEQTEKRGQ